jgi:hypothetical protein
MADVKTAPQRHVFTEDGVTQKQAIWARDRGISLQYYVELKNHIYDYLVDEAVQQGLEEARVTAKAEAAKANRDAIIADLTPKLTEKITEDIIPKLKDKIRIEVTPQVRKELEEKVRDEMMKDKPSPEDIGRFCAALRELEVDCYTLATTASNWSDRYHESVERKTRIGRIGLVALLCSVPFVYRMLPIAPHFWTNPMFWVALVPFVTLFITAWAVATKPADFYYQCHNLLGTSSNYLRCADRAASSQKLMPMVRDYKAAREEYFDIYNDKAELDKKFSPSVKDIDEARPSVKMRLADELDPEKLLIDDFDEKLKEKSTG